MPLCTCGHMLLHVETDMSAGFLHVAMCVNPPALHGGISQVNPSHSVSDEKNTASHTKNSHVAAFFLYKLLSSSA